jgi:two-component system, LytTR family, response regulator LytT
MELNVEQAIEVLIIEDDPISAESMELSLSEFGFKITGVAHSIETTLMLLNREQFDIALVDIDLNGSTSGIEIGRMLTKLYQIPFIFITGLSDNNIIEEAIKAKPAAYLQKPASPATLFACIQTAIQNFNTSKEATMAVNKNTDFFFVKTRNKLKRINWQDVVLLTSADNYTIISVIDKSEYYIRSSLSMTIKFQIPQLFQKNFLQANRSEVVQMNYITEVVDDEIYTPIKKLVITKSYQKEIKEKLNIIG